MTYPVIDWFLTQLHIGKNLIIFFAENISLIIKRLRLYISKHLFNFLSICHGLAQHLRMTTRKTKFKKRRNTRFSEKQVSFIKSKCTIF